MLTYYLKCKFYMKTRFTFYICLIFWVGCMWQSCHNDNSAMVPEKESGELAMEDVLQMYLGAGFEFDSVKTTAVAAKVQKEIYFLKRMKPSSKTISPLSSIRRKTATVFLSER